MIPILLMAAWLPTPQNPTANTEDVKSEDAIIKAVYDVISGPAGKARDWDRFQSLFDAKGTLCAVVKNRQGKKVAITMTPDDYVKNSGPYLEKNGFFERESKRKSMRSGDLVMVFSDYESRNKPDDKKPFEVGTNSLQLFTDGTRWYVHSILWQGSD
ncbi:MAG: hypothetical protein GC165_09440 [Armatimonadetes bacterium]|nr:hypothetical protein [Armatimonadota bacterium]